MKHFIFFSPKNILGYWLKRNIEMIRISYNICLYQYNVFSDLWIAPLLRFLQSTNPSGAKLSALGIYLLVSLLFVISTMVEFAFVLCIHRMDLRIKGKSWFRGNINLPKKIQGWVATETTPTNKDKIRHVTDTVDFISFCCFTLSFLIFNIVYFEKWSRLHLI